MYLPMKFRVDALHSFKVMLWTKKGTDGQTSRLLYATLRGIKNVTVQTAFFGGETFNILFHAK